jgi:urea carboxylase
MFHVPDPGLQTTVQDYPGRLGYAHLGVPQSGPMDPLAFRLANRIVGNPAAAAALECTRAGPTLKFEQHAVVAITGADMDASVDGSLVPRWEPVDVRAGAVLRLGTAAGPGARAYLAVRGGIDVPALLGSRATFVSGGFGGHAGRALRTGDQVRWLEGERLLPAVPLPDSLRPVYRSEWELGALYGPHGAPDVFTDDDVERLFEATWTVHHDSDRTGVRLIGPRSAQGRNDARDVGPYAVGSMYFAGDLPVLVGPDGPTLGGSACPAVIAHAELWKLGQLRPGDTVRIRFISHHIAERLDRGLEDALATLSGTLPTFTVGPAGGYADLDAAIEAGREPAILHIVGRAVFRASGDRHLRIEIGPNEPGLSARFRVYALQQRLQEHQLPGIVDVVPGVRSLQIHYDARELSREVLLGSLDDCERSLARLDDIVVPSRVVHLPLAWEGAAVGTGPGVVFDASYLVLALGKERPGLPVLTPIDPRHRRDSLADGSELMERTLQVWSRGWPGAFEPGQQWQLRCFDRIRFVRVTAAELEEIRDAFSRGRYDLRIEPSQLSLREYQAFLRSIGS